MSSPSPVTDGKHVWVLTGTGALAAFDMEGNKKWSHNLQEEYGEFGLLWGYASSPVLHDGKLIVEVLRGMMVGNKAYLIAYDAEAGNVVWKVERPTDATRECPDAYTTPALLEYDGRTDLIISGADYVTGHDPATGAEIWRAAGLNPRKRGNYRVVSSPVAVDGMIYTPSRKRPLLALKAGGKGNVTTSHLAWQLNEKWGPDVPTPACDGKFLYVVEDRGIVACLNAKNGEIVWGPERTVTGTVSASPLLADGKLYVTNENGQTTVLAAGPKFEIITTNELDDDYTLSSIAVSGSQLFIRTASHLYCIRKAGE
jgi:outer membrane protein assembly factor BamB